MTSENSRENSHLLSELWFNMNECELFEYIKTCEQVNDRDDLLSKFITMGIPALGKFGSGMMAEAGDIKICLSIELEKNNEIVIHVCSLDETGALMQRITKRGTEGSLILKTFICDFPDAMFITSDFKKLCLFTVNERDNKKLQNIEGPLNFNTFCRIVNNNVQKTKHIVVAVQK